MRMDCAEVCDLLQPFGDDELPPDERRAVALHLERCPQCADALAKLETLRNRIKRAGTHALPPGLENRVRTLLVTHANAKPSSPWQRHATLAASHVAAALLGGLLVYGLTTQIDRQGRATNDVISAHVRSLLSGQPIQVVSADPDTVRPWFAGKLAFSPPVKDLASEGYPLLGARVDYMPPYTVAAMMYGRRMHRITLFVRPLGQAEQVLAAQPSRDGYNTVTWRDSAFRYHAVSDLNRDELEAFAKLVRSGGTKP